jgi:acylphosphatase
MPESPSSSLCARRVLVTGHVTGVAFRWHARSKAQDFLGLCGSVRNRDSRTVECVLQGEGWMVEEMISWLRHGPSWARVTEVTVTPLPFDPTREPFHIAS